MESRVRVKHLQRAHPVRTMHVEPEAQVTQADAGRKRTPGGHLGDVAIPLGGGVDVQEFPITTFEDTYEMIGGRGRVQLVLGLRWWRHSVSWCTRL